MAEWEKKCRGGVPLTSAKKDRVLQKRKIIGSNFYTAKNVEKKNLRPVGLGVGSVAEGGKAETTMRGRQVERVLHQHAGNVGVGHFGVRSKTREGNAPQKGGKRSPRSAVKQKEPASNGGFRSSGFERGVGGCLWGPSPGGKISRRGTPHLIRKGAGQSGSKIQK